MSSGRNRRVAGAGEGELPGPGTRGRCGGSAERVWRLNAQFAALNATICMPHILPLWIAVAA
jgi:hypothetical protein